MTDTVYPSEFYQDPSRSVDKLRQIERKAKAKLKRKAYRAMYGCTACVRYHPTLKCCGDGQKPHDGGFCQYWWSDNGTCPAPEINRG